jgi:signal transduction histidine kinase
VAAEQKSSRWASRRFLPRFVAAAVFIQLALICFAAVSLYQSYQRYGTRAEIATQNMAQLLEHDLAASFDKIDLAVLELKDEAERQIAGGNTDVKELKDFAARQFSRQTGLDALGVGDARGGLIVGTGLASGLSGTSIASRDYFIQLRDGPDTGLVVSKPMIGKVSGKWVIVLARRINRADGGFAGVAVAVTNLERFQTLFAGLQLGPHGVVSLRDAELATVVRHPEPQGLGTAVGNRTHSKEWPEKLKQNPVSGTYFAIGLDHLGRVLSYHKVGKYPFYVIVGLYPADYLREWWQEAARTVVVVGIFVVLTGLFLWLVARAWLRNENDARRLEQLSHRLMAVQEQERKALALELHDVVSPNLAALKINLSMMEREPAPPDASGASGAQRTTALHADTRALLDETTVRLRQIGANLRPTMLDYSGLVPALKAYAEQFAGAIAITVKESGSRADSRLPPDYESLLFRIAQEAVTNCVKHAQASRITIELIQEESGTRMVIADDGIGFDVLQPSRSGSAGLGLLTMRERAEFMGGTFHVESNRRQGTTITVEI